MRTFCVNGEETELDSEIFLFSSIDAKNKYDDGESFEVNRVDFRGRTLFLGFFNKNDGTSEQGLFEIIDDNAHLLVRGTKGLMLGDGLQSLYLSLLEIRIEHDNVYDISTLYKLSIVNDKISIKSLFTIENGTIAGLRIIDSQLVISGMEYDYKEGAQGNYYAIIFDQTGNRPHTHSKMFPIEENDSCSKTAN